MRSDVEARECVSVRWSDGGQLQFNHCIKIWNDLCAISPTANPLAQSNDTYQCECIHISDPIQRVRVVNDVCTRSCASIRQSDEYVFVCDGLHLAPFDLITGFPFRINHGPRFALPQTYIRLVRWGKVIECSVVFF